MEDVLPKFTLEGSARSAVRLIYGEDRVKNRRDALFPRGLHRSATLPRNPRFLASRFQRDWFPTRGTV